MRAIACMSKNGVIGHKGRLPWHCREDLKFFKETTMGGILLMGRKTYESLGVKTLSGRLILILTRNITSPPYSFTANNSKGGFVVEGYLQTSMADDAERKASVFGQELFVCGGESIYKQFLPKCSELILTTLKAEYEGDAHFPEFKHLFELKETIRETEELTIQRFKRNS